MGGASSSIGRQAGIDCHRLSTFGDVVIEDIAQIGLLSALRGHGVEYAGILPHRAGKRQSEGRIPGAAAGLVVNLENALPSPKLVFTSVAPVGVFKPTTKEAWFRLSSL